MAFGDDDLAYMFSGVLSVPVVFGSQSTRGFVNEGDHVSNDDHLGPTQVRATTVTIRTGSLTGLSEDDALVVDGKSYTMRSPARIEDGKLTVLEIAEA